MDINDVLNSATVKKDGSKKSSIPTIKASDEFKETVTSYKEVQQEVESLTAKMKLLGEDIIRMALEEKERYMIETGNFIKSIKVPTTKEGTVTIVWSDWYSKIPIDAKGELENFFPENYNEFFENGMEIKVKSMGNEELKDLIKKVGEENFAKFFEVDRWITPRTKFTQEQHKLPQDVRFGIKDLVRQRTPSIKTK